MSNNSAQAALSVLTSNDPLNVHIEKIKDREFPIEELTAERFMELSDLIATNAEALGEEGLLNQAIYKKLDDGDFSEIAIKLSKFWRRAPGVVKQFLGLIFSAENKDDADYIFKHLKLFTQLPRVIKEFMRVNPWRDLADSFFQVGQEIRTAIPASGDLESPPPDTKQDTSSQ